MCEIEDKEVRLRPFSRMVVFQKIKDNKMRNILFFFSLWVEERERVGSASRAEEREKERDGW